MRWRCVATGPTEGRCGDTLVGAPMLRLTSTATIRTTTEVVSQTPAPLLHGRDGDVVDLRRDDCDDHAPLGHPEHVLQARPVDTDDDARLSKRGRLLPEAVVAADEPGEWRGGPSTGALGGGSRGVAEVACDSEHARATRTMGTSHPRHKPDLGQRGGQAQTSPSLRTACNAVRRRSKGKVDDEA